MLERDGEAGVHYGENAGVCVDTLGTLWDVCVRVCVRNARLMHVSKSALMIKPAYPPSAVHTHTSRKNHMVQRHGAARAHANYLFSWCPSRLACM